MPWLLNDAVLRIKNIYQGREGFFQDYNLKQGYLLYILKRGIAWADDFDIAYAFSCKYLDTVSMYKPLSTIIAR